jgi:hypothetical protein
MTNAPNCQDGGIFPLVDAIGARSAVHSLAAWPSLLSGIILPMTTSSVGQTVTYEGEFDCGVGFVIASSALGKSFGTVVGGQQITITLPRLGADSQSLIEPEWAVPPREVGDDIPTWGTIVSSREPHEGQPRKAITALVQSVRIAAEVPNGEDGTREMKAVVVGLSAWWSALRDWIEVASDQELNLHTRPWGTGGHGLSMWALDDDQYRRHAVVAPQTISVELPRPQDPELTSELLQRCMTAAGDERVIPLAWKMLRDARRFRRSGEYRRAVIDAGTAAEVAMTGRIDGLLSGVPAEVSSALLRKYQTLSGRTDLLKRLGGEAPERFQQKLAEPRNDAAHEGSEPSYVDTCAALEAAADVVSAALPIGDLLP